MARHGRTHGMTGTPTFRSWQSMFRRCQRPEYRGISIDPRWCGPTGFAQFLSDMGERPTGMTIDRINNDGNYEPGNCRWATPLQQGRNRRDNIYVICDGTRMALGDACAAKNLPETKVRSFVWYARRYKGISATEAFSRFSMPKRSWVKYHGTMMPLSAACKLAGLRWRPNIDRKAQLDGISLQAAFDHFILMRYLHW